MTNFLDLDTQAASQADQRGAYINKTGKYKGKFIKAEALRADSGTIGVGFTFESTDKQTVNFSLYIQKADGEKLSAYKQLNAIMACLRIRSISSPVPMKAKKYDYTQKKEVEYEAQMLTDLINKPIGILLQSCEYEKEKNRVKTGEYGWKMELYGVFEASTELTAGEILGKKTTPEVLATLIATLADRPLKNKANQNQAQQSSGSSDGFDDMIPF